MLGKFVGKLSYANVMATIAVFIAIGGGAYAAGLAKDSVGSKQIKDGQVKSADVKDDSLTGTDINESQLTLPQGQQGPKGDQGIQGIQGPPGQDGQDGIDGQDGVDGQDGADGSPDTAGQVLSKLLTVDGPASGLNADVLDGLSSTDFASAGSIVNTGFVEADFPATNSDNRQVVGQAGPFTFTGVCANIPSLQRNTWLEVAFAGGGSGYALKEAGVKTDAGILNSGNALTQIGESAPVNVSQPKYSSEQYTLVAPNGKTFSGQLVVAHNLYGTDDCYFAVSGVANS